MVEFYQIISLFFLFFTYSKMGAYFLTLSKLTEILQYFQGMFYCLIDNEFRELLNIVYDIVLIVV